MEQNYKTIELTRDKVALVSNEDYEELLQFKWYASKASNSSFYAGRKIERRGFKKVIYMHRVILKAEGQEVDHINGNTLDNRRENLRLVDHRQNMYNQKPQENVSSKYKGVYLNQAAKNWVVQIKDRGRYRTIHGVDSEEIAGLVYDLLALDRFKEYARFNFPEVINNLKNTLIKEVDNG